MKATRSHTKSTPHGGVIPILKKIQDLGIPQIIRKNLGERVKQAKYAYHDIIISWTLGTLCGCKRIEQITDYRNKLSIIPGLNLPSHDTIGRIMKKLATETKIHRSITTNKEAEINYTHHNENHNLNKVLVESSKAIKALQEDVSYSMDIDAMFIETMRFGAVRNLDANGDLASTKIGFNPMICSIHNMPIYISMRNGNAGAQFQIEECMESCLSLLDASKITIGRVTSDAAGYTKNLMRNLNKRGIKFNIRFPYKKNKLGFNKTLKTCDSWRKTEIKTANHVWKCEIADITYSMFQRYTDKEDAGTYRVVAVRIPTKNKRFLLDDDDEKERAKIIKAKLKSLSDKNKLKQQGKPFEDSNWKEIDGYLHKFYITNDYESSSEFIVDEYNKRGTAERRFSFMKKDFSWECLPFTEMNANLVFMITAALANNIFRGVVRMFKEKVPSLKFSFRLPKFKTFFIDVVCEIKKSRFVFFSQDILYDELMI